MTLSQKQRLFSRIFFFNFLPAAFKWADKYGFEITVEETKRSRETALANARAGTGIANSLHCDKLACDLILWRDGKPVTDSAEYAELGAQWEAYSCDFMGERIECCWGGRFKRVDGGHFSVAHNGRK